MTIQDTIKKMIEGGWKKGFDPLWKEDKKVISFRWGDCLSEISLQVALLDPEAWKCLGKAMGWGNEKTGEHEALDKWTNGKIMPKCSHCDKRWPLKTDYCWHGYWHDFIDHLAEGKSIESYFETL